MTNELMPFLTHEQHEALDDAFKDVYKKDGDKFVLNVKPTDGYSLENVAGLKKTLADVMADRDKRKRSLNAFKDIDGAALDPDVVKAALLKVAEMDGWSPEEKTREIIADRIKQVTEKFEGEKKEVVQERDGLLSQIKRLLIDNAAHIALGAFELVPRGDELLMPHIRQSVSVNKDEDSGEYVANVIDDKGNTRITMKQGETGNMEVKELVDLMRSDEMFAPAFRASGASGTGAGSGAGAKNTHNASVDPSLSAASPVERLKAIRRRSRQT